MTRAPAIVVLGMHRSGTSCVAGMLAAAGLASAGEAVRNWDNARGHHEMLELVRLNEAVLAESGGHWLAPPAEVRWTDAQAAARDRLLAEPVAGRAALLKDPRMLLVLPFWRASRVPFGVVAVVRHPLAVARSLEAWRGLPLADGVALWLAHDRALAADRARHGYPVIDFERPAAAVVAALAAACRAIAPERGIPEAALAAAYDAPLVHHDAAGAPAVPGLDDAIALYRELAGQGEPEARPAFPRAELARFVQLVREAGPEAALEPARAALAGVADAAAVLVPLVTELLRRRAHAAARALIAEQAPRLDPALAELLHGKVALAAGDAASAVHHLEAACAAPRPLFQARGLLPQALRAAGRHAEARAALEQVAREALYPHRALATLAEWSWLDGDPGAALAGMARAIAAAPRHRRGRLRTRRAEWLLAQGDPGAARAELELALAEDPGYARSREVLARATAPARVTRRAPRRRAPRRPSCPASSARGSRRW